MLDRSGFRNVLDDSGANTKAMYKLKLPSHLPSTCIGSKMRCFGIPDPAIPTSSYQTVLEPTKPNKTLPFPTTHHQSSCAASPPQKHFLYFHLPFLRMRHQSRTVGPLLETDAADTKRCLRGLAHKQAGWLAGGRG